MAWSTYQEAVFADIAEGSGHTVVLARAGSGKTTTTIEGTKRVPRGLSILMVAFNKDIALVLERRAPKGVEVKTCHGFGLRACSWKYGRDLKVEKNRLPALARVLVRPTPANADLLGALEKTVSLSKGCLASTAREVDALMDDFGIDLGKDPVMDRASFVDAVLKLLDWCKDPFKQAQMKSARERESHWVLFRSNVPMIDFDDMIWLPVVNELRVFQFDRVFIDETQDLNAAQIALALRACKKSGRILAVGDDRQAIYRFRGADENAVKNVIDRLDAKVLPLSITYRCPKSVVRVAQTIVPDLEWAPDAEEGKVAEASENDMLKNVKEGDFILSRTNAPLVGYCMRLLREGRRAHIQGRDVGAQLALFVKRSRCQTIEDLREYVDMWLEREIARLSKKIPPADTTMVEDRAATILALSEGCRTVAELLSNIDSLFSEKDPEKKIVLSTTHKAKGLERDTVYMLADTYLRRARGSERPNKEEENLFYVAVTRAKKNLFFVREQNKDGGAP